MRNILLSAIVIFSLAMPIGVSHAQDTNTVTATCKDGTPFSGTKRSGACRGHGGVQSWGTAAPSQAAPSQPAPAAGNTNTVTATCKDGTPFSGTKRSGACRGHGGVQSWGTAAATPPSAAPSLAAPPGAAGNTAAAPGGGGGQVWVNTDSKVYHCPGTRYYGKTKQGAYMSEAAAKAAGDRPAYGKGCGS
jgi:hypothetical protein